MKLIYSILCILGSSIYLSYLFTRKEENLNFWDKSMKIRGVLGGIVLFWVGIIMLYKYFHS